jgi:hypothetical protein
MKEYADLDKRLSLLEQKLDTIESNHLGVVFIQLVGVIGYLISNM